jgi:hypothetical protein
VDQFAFPTVLPAQAEQASSSSTTTESYSRALAPADWSDLAARLAHREVVQHLFPLTNDTAMDILILDA